jgi:hypothetical protein
VFYALFDIPTDFKKKQVIMTPEEFEKKVSNEWIRASIRYNELCLTGEKVRITWKKEDNTFSVGGTYGL